MHRTTLPYATASTEGGAKLRPLDCLSLVLPIYNEEAVLPLLVPRVLNLLAQLSCPAEVIFVNDGSRDRSAVMLSDLAAEHGEFKIVDFSRNFGHQAAITAGMDFASGDAVVILDADLQDPPELVLQMVEKYRQGYDVVYAQRTARHGETWFKRVTASGFYWLMSRMVHKELPRDAGDFRLMSRPVVDALSQMREQHRFVRGMVTWLGFRQTAIQFERPARAAGETKYPLRKMLAFAWRAITSFSGAPLRLALIAGLAMLAGALATAGVAGWQTLLSETRAAGLIWFVSLQLGVSGTTLLGLGLIGDYVSRIYDELKGRPLYVVRSTCNLTDDAAARDSIGAPATIPMVATSVRAPRLFDVRGQRARGA